MKGKCGQSIARDFNVKIPITQSDEWANLQDEIGEKYFFEKQSDFQYLAIQKDTPVGCYLYLPYGPIYTGEVGFQKAYTSLRALADKTKSIFIRLEPQDPEFKKYGPDNLRKVKDISPMDTWVLDLTPDRETLVGNFKHSLRATYRNYAKKGLKVEVTKDPDEIKHLVALQGKLYDRKHLNAFSREYLEAELRQPFASLYLVKYYQPEGSEETDDASLPADGQVIAASLFFDYDGTRYYMQSAADDDYRRLRATAALLIAAILDAKEQGIKEFDFWGIAPDGAPADHPWMGFTEFKKSFGGEARHYAGTYDIVLNKPKYALYNKLRKLHKRLS